jgi:surfeit locus 1 family protein
VFFMALMLWLGQWQLGRAEYKRGLQARYDRVAVDPVISLPDQMVAADEVLFRRVRLRGQFDFAHEILLDNRILDGVAGYHVITPLAPASGGPHVLVNRGWVAVGPDRESLPPVARPRGAVELEGIAAPARTRFLELGADTVAGRVWQNLDLDKFAAVSRLELQPVVLLMTSGPADGLARKWERPDAGEQTHRNYALQWFSLCAALAVIYVAVNLKRDVETNEL